MGTYKGQKNNNNKTGDFVQFGTLPKLLHSFN